MNKAIISPKRKLHRDSYGSTADSYCSYISGSVRGILCKMMRQKKVFFFFKSLNNCNKTGCFGRQLTMLKKKTTHIFPRPTCRGLGITANVQSIAICTQSIIHNTVFNAAPIGATPKIYCFVYLRSKLLIIYLITSCLYTYLIRCVWSHKTFDYFFPCIETK